MSSKNIIKLVFIVILIGIIFSMMNMALLFGYLTEHKPKYDSYTTELNTQIENIQLEIDELKEVIEALPKYEYVGEFKLTGYCPCEKCCGQWSGGPTASGVMPTSNHTVAADTSVFPFGTKLLINGIEYTVEDTGSAIKNKKIDIYNDYHNECFGSHCNGYAEVYIIKYGD